MEKLVAQVSHSVICWGEGSLVERFESCLPVEVEAPKVLFQAI